jgi:membrane protein required for beta-lactamase induction
MKLFKRIDLGGQVLTVVAGLLYISFQKEEANFINLYFITGGWQLSSYFIHLFLESSWLSRKDRRTYGKIVLWLLITGLLLYLLISIVYGLVFLYLFILLIITPVLATWYFIIGVNEWNY